MVAGGNVPEKLSTTLVRLRNLEIHVISSGALNEVLFIIWLIGSSPNLQIFTIEVNNDACYFFFPSFLIYHS